MLSPESIHVQDWEEFRRVFKKEMQENTENGELVLGTSWL
jgi:hypothetical protein